MTGGDIRLSEILPLHATAIAEWRRCRREYRTDQLLGVPASDEGPSADFGVAVHAMLRQVHETGSCTDAHHVRDVLTAHGFDGPGPLLGYIERHARRCPVEVSWSAHELDLARFHRRPAPMFMVTGRIDALWIHDGIVDARDYKTGGPPASDEVRDDLRARLQAWLLAERAARRGLRLRVRYEYLSAEVDDDPQPFEPDTDDLVAVEDELRSVAAEIWSEGEFAGVAEREVCAWCRYRSICPQSAAPAVPSWPLPPDDVRETGDD
jgi:RecB family exonuclease